MSNTPTRDQGKFIVRMPDGMRERLKDEAENSGRSMNSEIVSRIALTLEENVWERQKFIDLLNFKQHTIDKIMHMLFASAGRERSLKQEAAYEKVVCRTLSALTTTLCISILNDNSSSPELRDAAIGALAKIDFNEIDNVRDVDEEQIRRSIGDRDTAPPDWENQLSEQDKESIREHRFWTRDYE